MPAFWTFERVAMRLHYTLCPIEGRHPWRWGAMMRQVVLVYGQEWLYKEGITMNRFELFVAMVNRQSVTLNGRTGLVLGIELEDGSGHCFNVKMLLPNGTRCTVFVRG